MALFRKKKEKESEYKKGDVAMNPQEIPGGEVVSEETFEDPEKELEVPEIEPAEKPFQSKLLTIEELEKQQAEVEKRIEELNKREKELRPKERIQIVKEIPTAPVRTYKDEDGSIIHLMTVEEYLTEQANLE